MTKGSRNRLQDENIYYGKIKELLKQDYDTEDIQRNNQIDENIYYGKIKELLKQDYAIEDMKRELSKHKIERMYKRLRLEELRVENCVIQSSYK